jgi:hypothetical protein
VENFGLGSSDLSDFFSTISSGKKVIKEQKETLVGDSFDDLFWSQLTENTVQKTSNKKVKKKITPPIIQEELIQEELIIEKREEKQKKVNFTQPNYTEPPSSKNKDPLTPLNQEFLTVKDFNQHYRLFLNRIQQQLSTLGGGGETQLKYLDDVVGIATNPSAYDQKFLQYNHNLRKFEFVDPNDVAGTTIVNISGITTYYQALNIDDYIGVNADVPVTIVLPQTPSYGKKLIIKDEGNKISTYNLIVQAGIGKSVENDDSMIMKVNHQSFTFFYNGQNWFLI